MNSGTCGWRLLLVMGAALFLVAGGVATAAASTFQTDSEAVRYHFTAAEYAVFGPEASVQWQVVAVGSDIGGVKQDDSYGRSSNTGRKVKSGFLSLLLPGAGQYYNGQKTKAYVFAGVEAAIWVSFLTFDTQGDNRTDTYREYANIYASVEGSHVDQYWQAVGRFMDSDAYNESIRREARALGEEPSGLVSPEDDWQWPNEGHLKSYQVLRADANQAYDRRDFMILFAIVNRAVSVYDAVRNSVDDRLNYNVLGFHVKFDVEPFLHHPRAEFVATRNF